MRKLLRRGRYLDPAQQVVEGDLLLEGDLISRILAPGEDPGQPVDAEANLEGMVVFPGLINAHDHLVETFPGPGNPSPSQNWYEWEAEVKKTPAYMAMHRLSAADLYTLGMYRNVLSGVTTVVDHFPREVSAAFQGMPLVSLLEHFFLAHSVSARRLEWGQGIQHEFAQARGILPFIVHVGEGFSQDLQEECENLNRLGALGENTVLVNPLALSGPHLEVVATRKASIVWCPASCQNVFGAQPPVGEALKLGIRLTIGADRALANPGNLLHDLREARRFAREKLGGGISDLELIRMVTQTAAEVFRIDKVCGTIAPGKKANLLVFEDTAGSPLESFFALTPGRIAMVVHQGGLVFGDEALRSICSLDNGNYSEVLVEDRPKILMGRPLHLLDRIEDKLETPPRFPFLPLFPGK
ncbi:MAG: amidohydrolase family protein [Candidatus Riflebacteria bacterium]|nr:amidohydrolase family protein [Candidatus Riflebacteria bacterium]